jgi:thymidine kinase
MASKTRIKVVTGPMFSSKTSSAILEVATQLRFGRCATYITHEKDIRGHTNPATAHSGMTVSAIVSENDSRRFRECKLDSEGLAKFSREVAAYDSAHVGHIVVIDEAQLFENLVPSVMAIAEHAEVLICGIDFDVNLERWGDLWKIPATEYEHRNALCHVCASPAQFTARRDTNKKVAKVEDIGGGDKYMAVCLEHHPLGIHR